MVCARCAAELPEGARFCPACGAPLEQRPATDERKLATVLFADLVGSTALGEQDPERTRATLERFYDAMAAEVELAGGTIEKFAGDAVMAAFGAPAAQEDHAERALHAALSMQRRMAELFGDELSLRIGVNTGDVVVGRPREGSSFVTGDAVNVAARLEQAADPGDVLAGERTVAAARGAFEFADPVAVDAKGKADPVVARRLVRALSLMRPRGVRGLRRVFVGRASELELLQATFRRALEQREPHLVTIMGDVGIGKTTLMRELWQWLAGESPQPLQRTGRCLPYGHGITYWAMGEILKEHVGLLDTDSPETVVGRLAPREILGLTLGLDVAGELHPLAARDRLHEAWVEFLDELAAERPVVVLLEDLHWAEEPLLDLVERLLREVRGPVLVVGTARPELLDRRPAWGGGRRNTSLLWLEPLTGDDSSRLVGELLEQDLPEPVRAAIVANAEGNPFFVEELIGSLIDQGVLARRDGGWSAGQLPEGFSVPDTVHAILAARIDLLPAREKAGLQAASIVGRIFWQGPVCELLGGDELDCELLEDRDFVRRRSGSSMAGEIEYAFKHALTREVAYASVPKARRARLHARFAEWLERVGERRDDQAPLLAHHYGEAVRPEEADLAWAGEEAEVARLRAKALHWLERAGDLARGHYDLAGAIELYEQAVALEPPPDVRSRLLREIGIAHALRFDGEAFWTAMLSSLETCADRATCADAYSQLAFHTSIRSGMWRRRPDGELVEGWIERALEMSEPETPARVRALTARACWGLGEVETAREATALADRLGDPELRSWAWAASAIAGFEAGHYEEAAIWAERRFELVGEISDPDHLTEMLELAAPSFGAIGRMEEARSFAREHVERSRTLSPHHRLHGFSLSVEVEELAGEWDTIVGIEGELERAVDANLDTPCARNERSLLVCAAARAYLGDDKRSRELEEVAESRGKEGYDFVLDAPRLRLALARGDLERVADLAEVSGRHYLTFGITSAVTRLDALAALRDRDRVEEEAAHFSRPALFAYPFALRALGIVREDRELLRRALERFEELGLRWHSEQTRALL